MKIPSEGELIELEDWLSYEFREPDFKKRSFYRNPILSEDSAIERIRVLIAIARDPSELLRSIPDGDSLDRTIQQTIHPPRTGKPKPVPSLDPKQLGISQKNPPPGWKKRKR